MNSYYVYILKCKDQSLYTGYTNDLKRRIMVHQQGKGAKYTRGRGPFQLVFVEVFDQKSKALQREAEIKSFSKDKKLDLIQKGEMPDELESI